jgi:hypothetical protein
MRKKYFRAVTAAVAASLGICAFVASAPAQRRELTLTIDEYRGSLGVDSTGRRHLCDHLQKLFPVPSGARQRPLVGPQTKEEIALTCEGYHVKTVLLSVANWSSDFQALRSEALLQDILSKPYSIALDGLEGLVLEYGDKQPTSAAEIRRKLAALRARNLGDLLYACGFEKVAVRDRATKVQYLEQKVPAIAAAPVP